MTDSASTSDPLGLLTDLLRREREALVRAARREGASAEDAVDCVQDALCTFLGLHSRGQAPPRAADWPRYLVGVVENAARNRRRKHAVAKPHRSIDDVDLAAEEGRDLVVLAEDRVRLRACVAELCDVQRAVVMLRLLDESPGEDVARELGISRGYVDVLTHRAKIALRACMTRDAACAPIATSA